MEVSARHVFGRKNTSASMLWIYKNKNRITLRALALNKHIISASTCFAVRFPIEYQHSIWSNVLWRCRVYSVFKKINIVASKNIYIMYIYINSTLVSTIHIIYKNIFIKKYMWRTKNNIVCLPDMYINIRRENFLYNFIKKFLTQFSLYINIYSVRKSWPHRISTLFSYTISCAQYKYIVLWCIVKYLLTILNTQLDFLVMFLLTTFRHN